MDYGLAPNESEHAKININKEFLCTTDEVVTENEETKEASAPLGAEDQTTNRKRITQNTPARSR